MSAPVPPIVPPLTPPPSRQRTSPRLTTLDSIGRGASPILKIGLAAAVTVLAIAAWFYFGDKPPVTTGEVTHLTAYPIHRVSNAGEGRQGVVGVEQTFDEVIVIAQVRLHNQSKGPLFVHDMAGLVSLPDLELRSVAATTSDFGRVFIAYPQLAPMKQHPLLRDTTIPAGATVDGQLVFNYPITTEQWDLRRSMGITISFLHQKDLTMQAPQ